MNRLQIARRWQPLVRLSDLLLPPKREEIAVSNTSKTPTPTANFADVVEIPMTPVESSQLSEIGHDPASSTGAIRFKGWGDKPGSLYHYANFGETDFAALRDAESKGSHFIRNIKPHSGPNATFRYPRTRIIEAQG